MWRVVEELVDAFTIVLCPPRQFGASHPPLLNTLSPMPFSQEESKAAKGEETVTGQGRETSEHCSWALVVGHVARPAVVQHLPCRYLHTSALVVRQCEEGSCRCVAAWWAVQEPASTVRMHRRRSDPSMCTCDAFSVKTMRASTEDAFL